MVKYFVLKTQAKIKKLPQQRTLTAIDGNYCGPTCMRLVLPATGPRGNRSCVYVLVNSSYRELVAEDARLHVRFVLRGGG